MANLPESNTWEDNIYQLEKSDPVLGGSGGISNRQAGQLANRTQWLKTRFESLDVYSKTEANNRFVQQENNLSDLTSIPTARTNLGLGTAATVNTGTSGATIPLLNGVNTWSGTQTFTDHISIGAGNFLNDGDVYGSKWAGYLSDYLNTGFNGIRNTASKTTNGWFKDTYTGIIIQWGRQSSTSASFSQVTFPIAFPSSCFSVVNTVIRTDGSAGANNWSAVQNITTTGFQSGADEHGACWIATGY